MEVKQNAKCAQKPEEEEGGGGKVGSERQFEKQQKQKPNLTLFSRNDTRRRSALDPRVRYAVSTPSPTYPSSPPGPPKVCSFTFLRSRRGGNAHAQADVTKSFLPHARTHARTLSYTHTNSQPPFRIKDQDRYLRVDGVWQSEPGVRCGPTFQSPSLARGPCD